MAEFAGFHPQDFDQLSGSTWRSRDALGGLLAGALQSEFGLPYESWGARRRLELHIARREHYDFERPATSAKLFVSSHNLHTDVDELAYGFYVESPPAGGDQPLRHLDWLRFRDRVCAVPPVRAALLSAMVTHGLVMGDYYRAEEDGGALGGKYAFRGGSLQKWLPLEERWVDMDSSRLIHQLSGLPPQQAPGEWVNVHVFSRLSRASAIEMGPDFVRPILVVLRALVPLYELTVAERLQDR